MVELLEVRHMAEKYDLDMIQGIKPHSLVSFLSLQYLNRNIDISTSHPMNLNTDFTI